MSFLAMGGYAGFVWPAYGATALGLGIAIVWTLAAWRVAKARLSSLESLAALEKDRP